MCFHICCYTVIGQTGAFLSVVHFIVQLSCDSPDHQCGSVLLWTALIGLFHVISLLPPSLDLLQHSCSFLQLQLSRALCSFRGEKKDKILVRWERFYNRLLSFVLHAHAHIHCLEQRMVSGVATTGSCPGIRSTVQDSLRPLLLPLRVWAVLYSKVHTVSLERIFFRKFGVFNIRDTKRERETDCTAGRSKWEEME